MIRHVYCGQAERQQGDMQGDQGDRGLINETFDRTRGVLAVVAEVVATRLPRYAK